MSEKPGALSQNQVGLSQFQAQASIQIYSLQILDLASDLYSYDLQDGMLPAQCGDEPKSVPPCQ